MAIVQTRRAMVWTLVALSAGLFLVHCGSSGSSGYGGTTSDAPAAAPVKSGTSITYSSSTVSGHFHTFTLESSDLDSPPAAGVSGATSTASAHTHTVTVTTAQLQSVGAGQSVKVTTSVTSGHSHVFTFVRVA